MGGLTPPRISYLWKNKLCNDVLHYLLYGTVEYIFYEKCFKLRQLAYYFTCFVTMVNCNILANVCSHISTQIIFLWKIKCLFHIALSQQYHCIIKIFRKKNSWEEIGPPIGMFSTYTTSSKHAKRGVYLLTGIYIFEKKYYAVVLSIVIQME